MKFIEIVKWAIVCMMYAGLGLFMVIGTAMCGA